MLHEVLLGLSGHPSPLFDRESADSVSLASPAEHALLETVARLASVHRALRNHLGRVSQHHPSLICRAVATDIRSNHLARFQKSVVDVERDMLLKNSTSVAAHDIVPLASIVCRFEEWKRRLDWLWDLAGFMRAPDATLGTDIPRGSHQSSCNGRQLLEKLRRDAQTGFADIEIAALELIDCAEKAWLRQLVPWIVTGSVPPRGGMDFFVQLDGREERSVSSLNIVRDLVPSFVTEETASSILFIGRTINMLQSKNAQALPSTQTGNIDASMTRHLQQLASLPSPLAPTQFSSIISMIRSSLATEVVGKILPFDSFMNVLAMLRRFFLGGRGDFVDTLIQEADRHIANRHKQTSTTSHAKAGRDLAGIMMKEGEARAVLARTWVALAPFISKRALVDEELEWGRDHSQLTLSKPERASNGAEDDGFGGFLLLTPASLAIQLDATYDLFLSAQQKSKYSQMGSYLLAIRRAHNHLADLWRLTTLRRDHPAPTGPRGTKMGSAFGAMKVRRGRFLKRMQAARNIWHLSSTAISFLAELGGFLHDDVIEPSWTSFLTWASQDRDRQAPSRPASAASNTALKDKAFDTSTGDVLPRDPEVLAQGHEQFLGGLEQTMLLTNAEYTKSLQALLRDIDYMVGLVHRLEDVQRSIDLQEDGVYESEARNLGQDEAGITSDLDKIGMSITQDMRLVIDKIGKAGALSRSHAGQVDSRTGFQPFDHSATAVDGLLIRLGRELS